MNWKQVPIPCPKCGSWYRIDGDICNKCGEYAPVQVKHEKVFSPAIAQGRQWSKKLHRYLTLDEIKSGMRGG
jgi:hypothetical protein